MRYFCWLMTKELYSGDEGGGKNPVEAPVVTQQNTLFCIQTWRKPTEISWFYYRNAVNNDKPEESNDNPEFHDRGCDIRHPWPPFRDDQAQKIIKSTQWQMMRKMLHSQSCSCTACSESASVTSVVVCVSCDVDSAGASSSSSSLMGSPRSDRSLPSSPSWRSVAWNERRTEHLIIIYFIQHLNNNYMSS